MLCVTRGVDAVEPVLDPVLAERLLPLRRRGLGLEFLR